MGRDEAVALAAKLLRLARSDNPNEAALAAARAQEVIDKYKLSQLAVEQSDSGTGPAPEPDEPIRDFDSSPLDAWGANYCRWRISLASFVARANQCRIYMSHRGGKAGIFIIGRASDAETVRYLYAWIVREVDRLADRDGAGNGKTWRNNFRLGVCDTVGKRLQEQRRATEQAFMRDAETESDIPRERALVLASTAIQKLQRRSVEVDRWMAQNVRGMRNYSMGGAAGDYGARMAGREAGKSIALTGPRNLLS